MPETTLATELTGREIKERIQSIVVAPDQCGFEVYILSKSNFALKKMGFFEDGPNILRKKLKENILKCLEDKFSAESTEYVPGDYIADSQDKIYIIPTGEGYDPFKYLTLDNQGTFSKADVVDAMGVFYSIHKGEETLWVYQHLWSVMIPNKTRKNIMAKIISAREGDAFEELTDPIMAFSGKIDLIIVDDYIITDNYNLLEKQFGFHQFIIARAQRAITAIQNAEIVENIEKFYDYIQRGGGKTRYAKKMMRIAESKVLSMTKEQLFERIHQSNRWRGVISEENGKMTITTYSQVEELIDLLDERYTQSEITGTEYDTDVKRIAMPRN